MTAFLKKGSNKLGLTSIREELDIYEKRMLQNYYVNYLAAFDFEYTRTF